MRKALLLTLALICSLVMAASAAGAQYQRGSASAYWSMPGAFFTNWEQDIVVTNWNVDTFWNIQWTKIYGPTGYLGIQTPGGVNTYHFSMFGATGFSAPSGTTCTHTTEGGGAFQCQTPVGTGITNRHVRMKLIKSNRTDDTNRWWSAWASIDGGADRYLGQLQAPGQGWIQTAFNFHEYFGQGNGWNGSTCVGPGPPRSSAVFGAPTVSSPTMSPRTLARSGTGLNTCPGAKGQAIPFYDGVFTNLGDY